jgi:hypothetical protein
MARAFAQGERHDGVAEDEARRGPSRTAAVENDMTISKVVAEIFLTKSATLCDQY